MKRRKPLEGIRVLESGMLIAGPFAGALLAEFGAEVIKVEMPGGGDPLRNMVTTETGESLWFASTGRNKKSVALDLRQSAGRDIFRQLVKKSDVLIQAYRPGTLDRWGLNYESLAAENPRLIVLSISGYGQTGPYRERAGFGRTCQAFAGLTLLTGYPDRPPITTPYPLGDYNAALFGALGVMMALYQRDAQNVGVGQEVDVALYESVFRVLEFLAPEYHQLGRIRQRMEPWSANTGPTGVWESQDGKWVAITCTTDSVFRRLAEAMGQPELALDERYATQKARKKYERELAERVAQWVARLTGHEACDILNQYGVPASLCMSIEDIFNDPHYAARETITEVSHPRLGSLKVPNTVPKLSLGTGSIERLGPDLGEHTQDVLGGLLGLDSEEIARLRAEGVIA